MTFTRLALAGTTFYRRTNAAVILGIAAAVAVLAGSLLVGSSVRGSLTALATTRLGQTDAIVIGETPFTEALGTKLAGGLTPPPRAATPLLAVTGVVTHQSSGRRANDVLVYGVDARFFTFHGVSAAPPEGSTALLSPDLATELGVANDDDLLVRVTRPTDIPIDSLHGRRDDVGRSIRLSSRGALPSQAMGEFSLAPGQGPVRAVFIALERLQRDLALTDRVNTLLVSGTGGPVASQVRSALPKSVTAADLGLKVETLPDGTTVVESSSGLIPDSVARAIETVARRQSLSSTSVLTWLANRLTAGSNTVPYSIVTAIGPDAGGDEELARLLAGAPAGSRPIVLTEWAARDLGARAGEPLELEYYRWADEGRLVTDRASFVVAGIVPMRGLAVDRRIAPDYPGITTSNSFADWDPPFPINLKLVRPIDEEFWKQYRTAPKAFLPLAVGQDLWRTRHGQLTSFRLRQPSGPPVDGSRLAQAIAEGVDPLTAGFNVVDVRSQNLAASAGATDFGAYFSYFSFFLMVSALLLTTLFFRLGIEQRLSQIGILRATGFSLPAVRRVFLTEGALITMAGAALGIVLAIAWAALMMYGLRTWWNDAVGTTRLSLHVDWLSLLAGAAAAALVTILSITFTVRRLGRLTPRSLLTGDRIETPGRSHRTGAWFAVLTLAVAVALSVASATGVVPAAGGFFGAGALVLVGGLAGVRAWLKRPRRSFLGKTARTTSEVFSLALANAAWRPGRSLTATGLVAAAVFLLVSVDSFRKRADSDSGPAAGTGGFALIAESALPIVHDLSTVEGRREAGLDTSAAGGDLAGVDIISMRLRPGDDASCLNLYQPKRPRVLGVPPRLVDAGRFRFARTLATTDAERQNPWRLLERQSGDIPAIVDQTSLQYVLHASVGDVITIDADTARPVRLHIVASLDDSMLQGEILISDVAFERWFQLPGYRIFLVDVTPASRERADAAARALESSLASFGFDVQDTSRRLETYHRVENTYLSTFQALGGLGLMLGILGLVAVIARNVLERRRELALLGAAGFTGRDLQRLVVSEHLALVVAGLVIGLVAALTAIAPVLMARGAGLPVQALFWLVPVTIVGVAAAILATRTVRRLPLVESLRSE